MSINPILASSPLIRCKCILLAAFVLGTTLSCDRAKTSTTEDDNRSERQSEVKDWSEAETKRTDSIWHVILKKEKRRLGDTIGGRPITFYLTNAKVSALAKAFYQEEFRPTDDDQTTELLELTLTNDVEIRPFYVWCLDVVLRNSDGALGEYPGTPAFKYASAFPEEFFAYMDTDTSGKKYRRWVDLIAYSGPQAFEKSPTHLLRKLVTTMSRNCDDCDARIKKRIRQFATDIEDSGELEK